MTLYNFLARTDSLVLDMVLLVAMLWVVTRGMPYLYFRWGRNALIRTLRIPADEVARINKYEDERGITRTPKPLL